MTSPGWLDRYRSGRRSEVWRELRELGNSIRQRPELAEEAQLVCDEMAGRARANIEVIIERLTADGFRFHSNDHEQSPEPAHVPPTAKAAEHERWLADSFGSLPMTLRSWLRLVGDVWLVGTHPEWPTIAAADPLVIEVEGSRYPDSGSIRDYFADELEQWREMTEDDLESDPFVLPLAPDRLHKANISGGPPYGIILPDRAADGVFVAESTLPFVDYLNEVFQNGGFPKPTGWSGEDRIRRHLADGLLPL